MLTLAFLDLNINIYICVKHLKAKRIRVVCLLALARRLINYKVIKYNV